MVSSGANVIILCYHVMLSSGMITHPFFIFPENFTHSFKTLQCLLVWTITLQVGYSHSYLSFPCKIYFDSYCLLDVQDLIAVCLLFSLFWNIWAFTSLCPATGSSNGSLLRWVKPYGCNPQLVSKGWGDTFLANLNTTCTVPGSIRREYSCLYNYFRGLL